MEGTEKGAAALTRDRPGNALSLALSLKGEGVV